MEDAKSGHVPDIVKFAYKNFKVIQGGAAVSKWSAVCKHCNIVITERHGTTSGFNRFVFSIQCGIGIAGFGFHIKFCYSLFVSIKKKISLLRRRRKQSKHDQFRRLLKLTNDLATVASGLGSASSFATCQI